MKPMTLLSAALYFFVFHSCGKRQDLSGIQTESPQSMFEEPALATDKDGCLGRAGYTWSVVREKCVRVFDVGRRLEPVTNQNNTDFEKSMFFLLSDDGLTAEVYFPSSAYPIFLKRIQTDGPWLSEEHKLSFDNDLFTFYENEKPLFKGVGDIGQRVIGSDRIED